MTLDGRNAGGTPGDAERDARLDRLYREAGGEMPSVRLDAAILAAAHREVGARPRPLSSTLRRWRVPVSIAAAVVLSVSLVTLIQEEGGDRLTGIPPVAPPPAREQKVSPPVPAAMAEAGREDRFAKRQPERLAAPAASTPAPAAPPSRATAPVEARPAPADAAGGRSLEPFPGQRQEHQPQAAAMAPQPQAGSPALPDLLLKPAPTPSVRARDEATVGIRGMAAKSPSSVEARRPAAQAVWSDLERQPPEKWLERIEELRRASHTPELNELLAEFRKRFPDHPLPAWVR